MSRPHPLDRPVWNALRTGWADLAEGDALAARLAPDYGPFAAAAEPDDPTPLAALIEAGRDMWVVERATSGPPPGARVVHNAEIAQMVADPLQPRPGTAEAIELGDADAAEMLELATLTRPGPFRSSTHRFGGFVGLRENGALVAMAGERMRIDGYREVSGVCTHPDHRGRGHAAALMSLVARRIRARGDTPFLHAYAGNQHAIALYESLGFRIRTTMILTVIRPD